MAGYAGKLQSGDIVKVTQTVRVDGIGPCLALVRNVPSGESFYIPQKPSGSMHLEMVKRAVRKPKVGDVINGRTLRETQWRRGTTFRGVITKRHLVVTGGGELFEPDFVRYWEFAEVKDENEYTVEYLP